MAPDQRFRTIDGRALSRERQTTGLSQETLANALGVTPVTISRWESSSRIRLSNLRDLAFILDVPADLLTIDGDVPSYTRTLRRLAAIVRTETKNWLESLREDGGLIARAEFSNYAPLVRRKLQ